MSGFHTTEVAGTTILAIADEDNGYQTVKLTADQARQISRRGRSFFGHVARHQVVRDGQLAEFVTVATIGRDKFIVG